jgi:hypothetical protein
MEVYGRPPAPYSEASLPRQASEWDRIYGHSFFGLTAQLAAGAVLIPVAHILNTFADSLKCVLAGVIGDSDLNTNDRFLSRYTQP